MNRYIAIILTVLYGTEMQAFQLAPRLVVNITIDQLRSDYMEAFSPLFNANGFRRLTNQGTVFEAASYPFTPVDRASAIATLATGTPPYYNGIISSRWLDRNTLRPVFCVDDQQHFASPARLMTSTIGDELKVSTHGAAIVWSIAASREAAILSAGHAANGALWIDEKSNHWKTSTYYSTATSEWIKAYSYISANISENKQLTNDAVAKMAIQAVSSCSMGHDEVTDMLCVTLSATKPIGYVTNWQTEMESVYLQLDNTLGQLISGIEKQVGAQHVLFVVTSTGYTDEGYTDLSQYRIPTGTFYINRTVNLLNMYLGAIYGQGRFVETCYKNEMFLNHKLLEQKRAGISEVMARAQEFLVQNAGVADVYTTERLLNGNNDILKLRNGFSPTLSGDIIIEVAPGWKLLNEDTQETFTSRAGFVPFPIIFFGAGTKPQRITTPVTVDRIAPTIAKSIRIRAPNACASEPLF